MSFRVYPVAPIGTVKRWRGPVGGPLVEYDAPEYPQPPEGNALALVIQVAGHTRRSAAEVLGLSWRAIRDLERGALRFAEPEQAMRAILRAAKRCGDPKCGRSSGFCGRITCGKGGLDDLGYWRRPCWPCARAIEVELPRYAAWPPFELSEHLPDPAERVAA